MLSTFFLYHTIYSFARPSKQHRRFLISPASEAEEEKNKTVQAAEAPERHLLPSVLADSQVSEFPDGRAVGESGVILWMYHDVPPFADVVQYFKKRHGKYS